MSRSAVSINRKSSKSKESVSKSDATSSEPNDTRFPQVKSMNDVITNFFNQMVQYVIEDMIITEKEQEHDTKIPKESTSGVAIKDYKDLKPEDLVDAQITSAAGSKLTLTRKSSSRGLRSSSKNASKTPSLDVIKEEIAEANQSKTSTTVSTQDTLMDEEHEVRIIFNNGNVYEGTIAERIMNGKGKYFWTDGTVYEGDFKDGFPTGKGGMTLPDLSHFEGEFNQGLFNGTGFLNIVSTPSFYSGQWKNGMKHGQGWMLYGPGDWYEGGWANNLKDGFGVRFYLNGAKYRGTWKEGKYDGYGVIIWENNDYYDGEWKEGLMHGQGEYIWKAFYNNAFAFPEQTIYRGSWEKGKRCGEGIMHFGDDTGLRLQGFWDQDFKHGDGLLVCGNGRIVQQSSLFSYDKPKQKTPSAWSLPSIFTPQQVLDVPIFLAPEYLDVGYYIDKVLAKLQETMDITEDKLSLLKNYEEKCIRNMITRKLPKLKDLYRDYATMAAKTKLEYEPVIIRLFLWQFYKDMGIWKRGITLAQIDDILIENPNSCLFSAHDPFEPIYFWQFLMSMVGIALTTSSLNETYDSNTQQGGVCAYILKKFYEEIIFYSAPDHKGTLWMNYLDLAPIKAVYRLYEKLGEPHTARTFLKQTCTKKGESPLVCYLELDFKKPQPLFGNNLVPLDEHITFERYKADELDEKYKHNWTNLFDFRHLGPRNIVRCIASACPLVMSENLVVNIDYPLTFLEFYETLLTCIFMVLELEMKREQKILSQSLSPVTTTMQSVSSKMKTTESQKKVPKAEKKHKKKKKKHV